LAACASARRHNGRANKKAGAKPALGYEIRELKPDEDVSFATTWLPQLK
jgi:hypothetical protein